MKRIVQETLRIGAPILILAVGVAVFAAVRDRDPPAAREPESEKAPLVETVAVDSFPQQLNLDTDGLVAPFRELNLAAEVAGRITYKAPECRAGAYIEKGTLLIQIDPSTYELEVQRLEAELKQAQASLQELSVERSNTAALEVLAGRQFELQQRQTKRMQSLVTRGATTESELDDALLQELSTRNNLVTLKNQIQMIDARRTRLQQAQELALVKLKSAKLDLDRTRVYAPVDGVVLSDDVEQDSYVQPGAVLAAIEDTSAAEVKCSLRMEELEWVLRQPPTTTSQQAASAAADYQLPRTPATIQYRMGDRTYEWQGELTRYDSFGLDPRTRTATVRIVAPEPRRVSVTGGDGSGSHVGGPRALVRGMFVKVILHVQPEQHFVQIPDLAVRPGGVVWRVRQGTLNVVPIDTAIVLEDSVLAVGDSGELTPGDHLVVSPVASVADGMQVREERRL